MVEELLVEELLVEVKVSFCNHHSDDGAVLGRRLRYELNIVVVIFF